MADPLKCSIACLAFIAGGATAAPLSAQSVLPDPTSPPSTLSGVLFTPDQAVGGPVLESVFIPRKGRPVAIISGQAVRLGEAWGGDRLTRLSEYEAVLEGTSGIVRLRLTPDVEKTPIVKTKKARMPSIVPGRSTP